MSKKIMKKILLLLGIVSIIAVASPVLAKVDTVLGSWTLTAPSAIEFSCGSGTYPHTLNIVSQDENGDLTGTGTYDRNTGYTWDLTGNVSGDNITFTITYTGIGAGSAYNNVGVIAQDGSISGTTDSNCQFFSMPAGSGTLFEGNHGQYVKSFENKEDKKEAAKSRIGMPVQSKGHTK